LVPNTVQVYVVPLARPVTTSGLEAPATLRVEPPFDETHVAVKLVIAEPLFAPGVKLTRS
jgi:hypothetical protein